MRGLGGHSSQRPRQDHAISETRSTFQLGTPTNVGIFPIIDIFSYCDIGYADSTDTIILHFCFNLLFAEATSLSLRYSLCPVRKEQTQARSQKADILSLEIFLDIASSSLLRVH